MLRQFASIAKQDARLGEQYVFTGEQFSSMIKPNGLMAIQYAFTAKHFALVAKRIALIAKQYALVAKQIALESRSARSNSLAATIGSAKARECEYIIAFSSAKLPAAPGAVFQTTLKTLRLVSNAAAAVQPLGKGA